MQNTQKNDMLAGRIERLEKQNRFLTVIVSAMIGIFVFTGILELFPGLCAANAQEEAEMMSGRSSERGARRRRRAPNRAPAENSGGAVLRQYPGASNTGGASVGTGDAAGTNCCPLPNTAKFDVLEVKTLVLRDDIGNIRGMWSSDDKSTTLAVTYDDNLPSVALSVDANKASIEMNDRQQNTMSLLLSPARNSIYVADASKKNAVFMGTANGIAAFNLSGTKSSKVVTEAPESTVNIRGGNSLLQMQSSNASLISLEGNQSIVSMKGEKATLSMAEKKGGKASFGISAGKANLNYTDSNGRTPFDIDSTDGSSAMTMYSQIYDSTKVIGPSAGDIPDADTKAGIGY